MKRLVLAIGGIVFVVMGFIRWPLFATAQTAATSEGALRAQIDTKAKALDDINKKILQTQGSLNDTVVRGKTLKQEINKIDTAVKQVNLGIQKSEVIIDTLGLEIQSISQDISSTTDQLSEKRSAVTQLIQDVQAKDNENALLNFLSSKSLSESILELQTLSDLNSEILSQMSEIKQIKLDLEDRQTQLGQKKISVESEHKNLKAQKSIAEDQLNQRQQLLSAVKNDEQKYRALVSDLERQQQAISAEIDAIESQLRETYHATGLPNKRAGLLGYPVGDPIITQGYGATAFAARAYKTRFHNGIDFAAAIGTPVYAAYDGVVTLAGNNGRVQYGKFVLIKHENGFSTMYGHLSRQAVSDGMSVRRGDLIGYSGNTGYATGPHLHFGLYVTASIILKSIPGAGIVPAGYTLNPTDYL